MSANSEGMAETKFEVWSQYCMSRMGQRTEHHVTVGPREGYSLGVSFIGDT